MPVLPANRHNSRNGRNSVGRNSVDRRIDKSTAKAHKPPNKLARDCVKRPPKAVAGNFTYDKPYRY